MRGMNVKQMVDFLKGLPQDLEVNLFTENDMFYVDNMYRCTTPERVDARGERHPASDFVAVNIKDVEYD
jgi:hypothetical protein